MLYDPNWKKPEETTTEQWRLIVDKAADLIEKGWCQHALHESKRTFFGLGPEKHSYCIVGALQEVTEDYHEPLRQIERVIGFAAVWNDQKGRTQQEVVDVLRSIAKGQTKT